MHAEEAIRNLMQSKCTFSDIKATIKNEVSSYIFRKTERNPMIIPVIMNVKKKEQRIHAYLSQWFAETKRAPQKDHPVFTVIPPECR
jgi:ribonuclease J